MENTTMHTPRLSLHLSAHALVACLAVILGVPASVVAQCGGEWGVQTESIVAFDQIDAPTTVDPDGAGPIPAKHYAGGIGAGGIGAGPFGGVAGWSDGQTGWQTLGTGINGRVRALVSNSDIVYAGGTFTTANGVSTPNVAKWAGQWVPLDTGLPGTMITDGVRALAIGPNQQVFAGGRFNNLGVFAKWNGQVWENLGSGFNGPVQALTMHNGELIAGGLFTSADGSAAVNSARWDGSAWQPIGGLVPGEVRALTSFRGELFVGGIDDGVASLAAWNGQTSRTFPNGPRGSIYALNVFKNDLIAAGAFTVPGVVGARDIARWSGVDGELWRSMRAGIEGGVYALWPTATDLVVGGALTAANGQVTKRWARWRTEIASPTVTPTNATLLCGRFQYATLVTSATGPGPI